MAVARKRTTAKRSAPTKAVSKKPVVSDVDDDLADLDPVEQDTVDSFTAIFDLKKETPGTWQFSERVEEGQLPISGAIYMKKTAMRKLGEPSTITITYTVGEPS